MELQVFYPTHSEHLLQVLVVWQLQAQVTCQGFSES